ncbi:MAG: alanine--tRNA ligase, partial [Gammaproteobacteria bacterium]
LVPASDATLLFTNAGMVQFKNVFLGREQRPFRRAASCQACVRAGGKHNDLENVGHTARHHTFFEMLGNFSFGDYFKREAIHYAWEFLTESLGIDPARLWITVFQDDDEAASIWLDEIRIDKRRLSRCGEQDNFWTMGATGPCGPSSEIFFDHGAAIAGGPPGSPDQNGDRYVEIWNLVFTQYDRDDSGRVHPIPHPSVDTGMGLERIAAVMQGVHSNYDIDTFRALMGAVSALLSDKDAVHRTSVQVIADHIRASAFIAAEGVVPSNEGRGYVLRRIIRRAVRHGRRLGLREPFFHRLIAVLATEMGTVYPRLAEGRDAIERVLKQEEERFAETLDLGLKLLERSVADLSGSVIPGRDVFQLYDTYGFPVDLTADIARERGLTLDMEGFEREMQQQRERARTASQFGQPGAIEPLVPALAADDPLCVLGSEFTGYAEVKTESRVVALYREGERVPALQAGEQGVVVLDKTPFYAEAGGQVGDIGDLCAPEGLFRVSDTRRQGGAVLHLGMLTSGALKVGETVHAQVDPAVRSATALNHSATHLLHAALRQVLGAHVLQKGSLVAPERLRFDFSHTGPLESDELREVECLVNREIRANREVETQVMPVSQALASGALALFGEKYEERVRVLKMGDFSVELCGGTHVRRSGDIGLFKIVSETGVAAGVRRIEAQTGEGALAWVAEKDRQVQQIADLLKAPREQLGERIEQLLQKLKHEEKQNQQLRARLSSGRDLSEAAVDIAGVKVLAESIDDADPASLRAAMDRLKDKLAHAVIVLASVESGKVVLVAGVTKDLVRQVKAGDLVNFVAQQVGGKGGGRPDFAQAGGSEPGKLKAALATVGDWVRDRISP